MRSPVHGSPSAGPTANVFSPTFLAALRERDEVLTAAEAEYAGPWRQEAVRGKPGAVAVLRAWEEMEQRDVPEGVFWHQEIAWLLTLILPLLEREPLFHLGEEETAEGFPVTAVYGEQGAQVFGWLRRYEPRIVEALHLLEGLLRSPSALAVLLETAGPGAIEQIGRILARRMAE